MPPKNKKKTQESQPTSSKQDSSSSEKQWSDESFNDAELTMPQLKNMIITLATEVYNQENLQASERNIKPTKGIKSEIKQLVALEVKPFKEMLSNLQKDVTDLISTTQQLIRDSEALNNLQQGTDVSVEQIDDKVELLEDDFEKKIETVRKQPNEKDSTIKTMKIKIDEIEQRNNQTNLRIVGLQELEHEDVTSKIVSLARDKLKIQDTQANDFQDVRRMGPKNHKPNRDIVVMLCTHGTQH